MTIVVCASMSASKEMIAAEKILKSAGHTVILPDHTHEYANMKAFDRLYSESVRDKADNDLIREHYRKIRVGDAILAVNPTRKDIEGYIGANTFLEIGFAHVLKKKIFIQNKLPATSPYLDELLAIGVTELDGKLANI